MEHEHKHDEKEVASEHEETHHHKKKRRQSNKSIIAIVIALIVIILAVSLTWLYTGKLSQAKEKVFKKIPLPAAIVDMQFISAKKVLSRIELAKQLSSQQEGAKSVDPSQTFSQLVDAQKIDAIASQHHISVTKEQIDEEYQNIIKQYANGDENAFKDELNKTYHMSTDQFKDQVIKEEVLQGNIQLWYNGQTDLDKDALNKAKELQDKINGGQNFDDVAKAYTQDEATKDFAGDSGMIAFSDLLPEFRDGLKDAKVGDSKTVVSRYGIHIFKVLERNSDGANGSEQIHLQQIFVKPNGFSDWMSKQTDNVRVIKLLKFN